LTGSFPNKEPLPSAGVDGFSATGVTSLVSGAVSSFPEFLL
jgi:hypothetical protein